LKKKKEDYVIPGRNISL